MSRPRAARLLPRLPGLGWKLLRHGLPARTLLFGALSVGDDLLCSTVLREARLRGLPFAMMTSRPALFANNPDPSALLPVDDYHARLLRALGRRVIQPYYAASDPAEPDRDVFADGHILARMCSLAGLEGEIALRPYFHLTEAERAAGRRAPRQIAFQTSAAAAAQPFANKEWIPARFGEVVAGLPAGLTAIQLGSPADPPLAGALDLRGRTTLREAAAVIAGSDAFVGLEGFLAHMARAVDRRAVIVLGGRVPAGTVGYPCNEYLSAPMPCAPCGLRNRCAFGRNCLAGVSAGDVLAAIGRALARPAGALELARVRVTPDAP
jgi:hypothetical protein